MNAQDYLEANIKDLHDMAWRVLPLDAAREEKFKADMVFEAFTTIRDSVIAHGYIYNDSRSLFIDGTAIRTSAVKETFSDEDGVKYIETRNTIYRIIG
jgi:hypothetical protein